VANLVWQKRYSRENREAIGDAHDHVLVYAANPQTFKEERNLLPIGEKQRALYKNPDKDPRGAWQSVSLLAQGFRPNQMYEIVGPNGKKHTPPAGNCWKVIYSEYEKLLAEKRVYFGKDGNGVPRRKEFLSKAKGLVPWTWWPHDESGHNDEAKKECNSLFGAEVSFGTPKPERLIQRIIHIATNNSDIVLDSFLGSGTTAAVAHKMGRRYIGIEDGQHAVTHCAPRLQKVIDGEQGGISEAVGWKGGGGFRFYRLGNPVFDEDGHINTGVSFAALAAHVWFCETGTPYAAKKKSPLLGVHDGTAYYLLYNGILGDTSPDGGNVLTGRVLESLPKHAGQKIIYGELSRLGPDRLKRERIIFKQIPYDVTVR
jgi:adenine-specific DNA-methyltransferase